MNDVSELLWGVNDKRVLLVRALINKRANLSTVSTVTRKQKVGDDWVTISETSEPDVVGDEFQSFCQSYLDKGAQWYDWVKASPALQEEARLLWGQLLIVAGMVGTDFAVPTRMLRAWQKALAERIIL